MLRRFFPVLACLVAIGCGGSDNNPTGPTTVAPPPPPACQANNTCGV